MASERDTLVKFCALLDAGKTPTDILKLLGVARMSVYCIGKKDNIERKRGSDSKAKVNLQVIKKALEAEPLKTMRAHAKDMGISHTTIFGEENKSCPSPTLASSPQQPGRVIIFSDEKTWTVDPVRSRRNDRYLSFGEIDKSARTLITTKHPASALLKAADYIKVLKTKFLPWVRENFPDGNVVFQQDGAPAHTTLTAQNWLKKHVEFWSKGMWPPYS
ncbi:Putative transposable element [Caligus rogercresseyi]|uniref:Transposable element n=1 Tax=Caligus rogercresseyi TaxID=217165 RepID=A0A7T8GYE7_CALRO|nr:Putative transposable element [Caligus rogercresseyi]